jgi:hypothetical protein
MGINSSRLTQKNGPNRKLLRSIVSPNPAHSAQSMMDQCRANNSIKAPAISTYVSMRFEPKPISKPISSQSHSQRHYRNNFVATWMQMRTIATKACMKSKRPRDLSGARSNISGQKHPISSKSKAISAEKREKNQCQIHCEERVC